VAIQGFRDLKAWQLAMDFVEGVYQATAKFPAHEQYGLTGQLRRSAVSIPSNIAEGRSRDSSREFLKFLSIAYGSLAETQTQLEIARRLAYLDSAVESKIQERGNEVGRVINGLAAAIRRRLRNDDE
jgi:four helix bundle protein